MTKSGNELAQKQHRYRHHNAFTYSSKERHPASDQALTMAELQPGLVIERRWEDSHDSIEQLAITGILIHKDSANWDEFDRLDEQLVAAEVITGPSAWTRSGRRSVNFFRPTELGLIPNRDGQWALFYCALVLELE